MLGSLRSLLSSYLIAASFAMSIGQAHTPVRIRSDANSPQVQFGIRDLAEAVRLGRDIRIFAEPVRLSAGARIVMQYSYDNRTSIPRNPSSPPQRVVWGWRSQDEMGGAVICGRVYLQTESILSARERFTAAAEVADPEATHSLRADAWHSLAIVAVQRRDCAGAKAAPSRSLMHS